MARLAAATPTAASAPTLVAALLAEGRSKFRAGDLGAAEAAMEQALDLVPDDAEALNLKGVVAWQTGRLDEAFRCITAAIERRPNFAPALNTLGGIERTRGRFAAAVEAFARARAIDPTALGVITNLALALADAGRYDEAIAAAGDAISRHPKAAAAHLRLGEMLARAGRHGEAIAAMERAAALAPQDAEVHSGLGYERQINGDLAGAIAAYERALAIDPKHGRALQNLGRAFNDTGDLDRAEASLKAFLAVQPESGEGWANLAVMRRRRGDLAGSLELYQRALKLEPNNVRTRYNHALTLLSAGDFTRGLREHEWRGKIPEFPIWVKPPQPLWDGTPLAGRTLLIHAEQGLGDTIQFVRYASLVAGLGLAARSRVILLVQPQLVALLGKVPGVDRIILRSDTLPAFDVHAPLLSLPLLLGTTSERIPAAIPYLACDPRLAEGWATRLAGAGGKIGFVWAGNPIHTNDHSRSLKQAEALALAKDLLATAPDLRLYGLQIGERADDIAELVAGGRYRSLAPELTSFAETAAAIDHLDAVVAVDTSVAHVAGALGKTIFTLLPCTADWRWLTDSPETLWYPTMRLCRQAAPGDWSAAFDQASREVAALVKAKP
ncbi:MAG: glycosyl transferase family 9 [Rhodospirillales bacterium]|nr:glycosyl transferase family 9 [Rhodospirillales bacterium]